MKGKKRMKSKDSYLRSVRHLLYVRGKWEKRFLANLRKDMEEYERIHPGAVSEDLTEEFGTPIGIFSRICQNRIRFI